MSQEPKQHDYAFMMLIYSVLLNVMLIISFGVVFWNLFLRSEWNAGWVACRNNMGIVTVDKGK